MDGVLPGSVRLAAPHGPGARRAGPGPHVWLRSQGGQGPRQSTRQGASPAGRRGGSAGRQGGERGGLQRRGGPPSAEAAREVDGGASGRFDGGATGPLDGASAHAADIGRPWRCRGGVGRRFRGGDGGPCAAAPGWQWRWQDRRRAAPSVTRGVAVQTIGQNGRPRGAGASVVQRCADRGNCSGARQAARFHLRPPCPPASPGTHRP
mmetsp:Transcript_59277/g.159691  ORF Transcript_59277/g.159691 Transcript_59277/m.159691 type:complete len:207 (-) Transcript_59277:465-1085(-)